MQTPWRVQSAASNSTAERLCCTLISPPVSGMTRPKISTSRKSTVGLHKTLTASFRHPTITCSRLSSAPTKQLPCLSAAESLLNCLESTVWSRTDHLVIVSLKVHISIATLPHLASGCSASPSNARSRSKISSPILPNSVSKTRHVLRATHQQ